MESSKWNFNVGISVIIMWTGKLEIRWYKFILQDFTRRKWIPRARVYDFKAHAAFPK